MTVDDAKYIIGTFLRDKANIPELGKDEYNDVLKQGNISFLNKLYAQKKQEAAALQIKLEDYLSNDEDFRPLKTKASVVVATGTGSLPSNYFKYLSVSGTLASIERNIQVLDPEEINKRKQSVFGLLDIAPVCNIYGGSIDVLPTNITPVTLIYLKEPAVPVYAETYSASSGLNEYDSGNSTQWDWNEHNHAALILEMLGLMGFSANYEDIKKYLQK